MPSHVAYSTKSCARRAESALPWPAASRPACGSRDQLTPVARTDLHLAAGEVVLQLLDVVGLRGLRIAEHEHGLRDTGCARGPTRALLTPRVLIDW